MDEWLIETNTKLVSEGVPAESRYRRARKLWVAELSAYREGCGDTEEEKNSLRIIEERSFAHVESFFLTKGRKRHATGIVGRPIYRAAFYYLGDFWPFYVPLIMGQRAVRFLECLESPPEIASMLRQDEFGLAEFAKFGEDCIDYGYAIGEVGGRGLSPTANRFFVSADAHLTATSQMLFMAPEDTKPLLDAAMSIEIFCKAYLAVTENKAEDQLKKKYSHNVERLVQACCNSGLSELYPLVPYVKTLPGVEGRYSTEECVLGELWAGYRAALMTGVTILRDLTGRDCRK